MEKQERLEKKIHKQTQKDHIREAVLDGTIPSACSDTGATSNAGKVGDPFIPTDEKSTKQLELPHGGNRQSVHNLQTRF